MLDARGWLGVAVCLAVVACHRPSLMEKKIVGAWSWTYIEGRGRMVFTADHKVKAGFPPEEDKGRPLRDEDFTYLQAGTWRLEGDTLVTEMDNSPYIAWYDQTFKDKSEEMRRERPVLKKEVRRQKIVTIDDEKMRFDDRSRLDRVKL